MINQRNWDELTDSFRSGKPYNHVVIDNFWSEEVANQLTAEYPNFNDEFWYYYKNLIEDKKTCNQWDRFPSLTYQAFSYLNSSEFVGIVERITGQPSVKPDVGLHGGGWHIHGTGGKLNIHLDYSIHPKLKLERHFNLIIYMTPDWDPAWGGGLELWSHNHETNQPKELVTRVENRFNRAVIFDTTQYSWHGLPDDLNCPTDVCRKSMAVYYLTDPATSADPRGRALFAPHKDQANNPDVLELIKLRSDSATVSTAYKWQADNK